MIVAATALVVAGSALVMRLLDHSEYHHLGRALWWAMQTVTTVGYGDVTPEDTIGRVVAALVMLWGIALIAILTALITSTFVARASAARALVAAEQEEKAEEQLEAKLDALAAGLQRVEQQLAQLVKS